MLYLFLGNQVNYQFQVAAGDPDYVALWDRMENQPEDTLYKTIKEGIPYVMHVMRHML